MFSIVLLMSGPCTMGAALGPVNRSAASPFQKDVRFDNRLDDKSGARPKPPELLRAEHDVFATTVDGDPDAPTPAEDPPSLG
jgi:hypothetical protein